MTCIRLLASGFLAACAFSATQAQDAFAPSKALPGSTAAATEHASFFAELDAERRPEFQEQDTFDKPKIQPKARNIMEKMGKFYASLDGATFTSTLKVEGQDMPFPMTQTSEIKIAKPNLFWAKAGDSMMGGVDAASNGKMMMLALPMFEVYQEVDAPKNFDDLIPESEEDMMEMDESLMPLAQDPSLLLSLTLFSQKPTTQMLADVKTIEFVGTEQFGEHEATHLSVTSGGNGMMNPTANAELWIATGDEPWLLGVKPDLEAMMGDEEGMMPGDMTVTLLFDDWKAGRPPADAFVLTPDESWEKVDDLMAAVMEKAAAEMAEMNPDDFDFGDEAPEGFEPPDHATVGTEAPAFALKTLRTDKEVTLASLKGKVVVLDFWATWCSPCVAGLPIVDKVASEFKDKGVVFYAIDLREPADRVKKFVDKKKWTFPVLMDGNGSIAKEYGVNGIPHSVVIGADGKIRNVHIGFGGAKALEKQLTEELESALSEASTQG